MSASDNNSASTDLSDNPLLQVFTDKNQAPPFDKIKTEHYVPALEECVRRAQANIEAIKTDSAAPSFENTIEAIETAAEDMDYAYLIFYNAANVLANDEINAADEKITQLVTDYETDIGQDDDLFARVKIVYDQKDQLGLTKEQEILLEKTYKSFVRNGALLEGTKKDRFKTLNAEIQALRNKFTQNVTAASKDAKILIEDEAELAGLPDRVKASLAEAAEEDGHEGKWLLTMDPANCYFPVMQYCEVRETREKLFKLRSGRCTSGASDNRPVIMDLLKKRHERAQLLGYDNHAEFVLEERMPENLEDAMQFLKGQRAVLKPAADKEKDALEAYAQSIGGPSKLEPWDKGFYSRLLKAEKYEFDAEELRPYFAIDNVLRGVFDHYEKLFGVQFVENTDYPVYHDDVPAYDVMDKDSGDFLGTMYMDFYPRKGEKRAGAWHLSLRRQGLFKGEVERPVSVLSFNLTKPTGDKPALLSMDNVTTIAHETGHGLHNMLSDCRYRSLSGSTVSRDFVELPSQVQERWFYKKEVLDTFARHYETGDPIPEDLLDKMIAAQNYNIATGSLVQNDIGLVDMSWHSVDPNTITESVEDFERLVLDADESDSVISPVFSHIFGSMAYDASYYGYRWSEVLDADAFSIFEEKGLYDPETANKLKALYAAGGSDDLKAIFEKFAGREVNPDRIFEAEGLIERPAAPSAGHKPKP